MEKITKTGKDINKILDEIMAENNLSKEEYLYSSKILKEKLFGNVFEVNVFLKSDIRKEIKKIIEEIISNMGLEVSIEISNKEDRPIYRVYSNNDKVLIGKNGNTLKSLELLVKQAILNETGVYYKFSIDVSDYKEKNIKRLENFAKRMAKEVQKTNVEVTLDNMTSYERRIVHNCLANFKGIKTESEGEEPNRHVVIKPL